LWKPIAGQNLVMPYRMMAVLVALFTTSMSRGGACMLMTVVQLRVMTAGS